MGPLGEGATFGYLRGRPAGRRVAGARSLGSLSGSGKKPRMGQHVARNRNRETIVTTAVVDPTTGGSGGNTAVAARAEMVVKAYGSGETQVLALDGVSIDVQRGA